MFRPAIQRLYILILMAVFCVLMVVISYNSQFDYEKPYYNEKVKASNYMFEGLKVLRESYSSLGNDKWDGEPFTDSNEDGIWNEGEKFEDTRPFSSLDPLETGMVFYQDGLDGDPSSKLTTLNPNFAALVVELMVEAGIESPKNRKKKPRVAIAFSGSIPGANLAVLSACKAMDIEPFVITSVSGSNYGAVDYQNFSWLAMEATLIDQGIFPSKYRSQAASIGRKNDIGLSLSAVKNYEIDEAIKKSDINRIVIQEEDWFGDIQEGDWWPKYIDKRMKIYDSENIDYDLFINVGGGVASIGAKTKIRKTSGFVDSNELKKIYKDNSEKNDCVASRFSQNKVPIINIMNIKDLVENNLPVITLATNNFKIDWEGQKWINEKDQASEKESLWKSEINKSGILFIDRKYSFWVVIPCLMAALMLTLGIGLYSHFQIKKRMTSYEPDSVS